MVERNGALSNESLWLVEIRASRFQQSYLQHFGDTPMTTRSKAVTARPQTLSGERGLEGSLMADCKWVDDDIIEHRALGRIEDGFIREHLDHCYSCKSRVAEICVWLETLREGLRTLRESLGQRQQANDDDSNRQDGS